MGQGTRLEPFLVTCAWRGRGFNLVHSQRTELLFSLLESVWKVVDTTQKVHWSDQVFWLWDLGTPFGRACDTERRTFLQPGISAHSLLPGRIHKC